MGLSRRALIKQAGAAIAALGLVDVLSSGFSEGNNAYGQPLSPQDRALNQALAQAFGSSSGGRKFALLIGINEYPETALASGRPSALSGCTTDVALQRQLLIHRFGFAPADVLSLVNEQATRTGIYQAFEEHLYRQAKAGDKVVIHFSGYGALVRINDLSGNQQTLRSLVPFDGRLPTESRPALNDILEVELKTLIQQLKSRDVTTLLDAGFVHVSEPLSGGLRSRARSAIATGTLPAPFPLLTHQQLLREGDPFPGTLLRGAAPDEAVLERQWSGFSAGSFTYGLTQYLWSAPAPVSVSQALGQSQSTLLRWGRTQAQPMVSGRAVGDSRATDRPGANAELAALVDSSPIYHVPVFGSAQGEGVIQSLSDDGQRVTLWLGGVPQRVLEYLGPQTILSCGNRRLKLRSRDGLTAKAIPIPTPVPTDAARVEAPGAGGSSPTGPDSANSSSELQVGQPFFEAVRVLPKSINLIVALDSRLERIERVDATSALSALTFVTSTSDTDLPADYLLAKPVVEKNATLTASLRPVQLPGKTAESPGQSQPAKPRVTRKSAEAKPVESTAPAGEAAPEFPLQPRGYGLFSLTRSPIPGTLALQDEAIKPAIARLSTKLQTLLALKLLRLSENQAASRLPVRVTLEMVSPEEKQLLSCQTLRTLAAQASQRNSALETGLLPQIPLGSRVRYRIFNDSAQPLYYTLINVDPRDRLSAFFPASETAAPSGSGSLSSGAAEAAGGATDSSPSLASIAPGSAVTVPSAQMDLAVELPVGPVETYVVCSTSPLTRTFDLLLAAAVNNGGQRINPLPNPMAVMEALLSDLSQANSPDSYSLDVNTWATLSFTYEAV